MITLDLIILLVVLAWLCLYTASYGRWTWKKQNKVGAIMIFIIAVSVVALPVYTIFFRE
ncbi:MAG: hypothetical protein N3B21_15110 [Clostridia bacterium]|nr:hypothetical protein [Clostridia bacterium]